MDHEQTRFFRYSAALFGLLVLFVLTQQTSCSCSDSAGGNWGLEDQLDGGMDADTNRPTDGETGDAVEPSDSRDDRTDTSADRGAWEQPNPCDSIVEYPEVDREFSKPDRPFESEPLTRQRMLTRYGGTLPRQGISRQVAEWLEESTDFFDNTLFAEVGEAVTIRYAYVHNPETAPEEPMWLTVAMLADYAPTNTRLVRWNADRTEQIEVQQGTGFHFEVERDVELFDLTFPAGTLSDARMYEITTMIDAGTESGINHIAKFDRLALFNGGYQRPSHPCFEPPLDAEWTDTEHAAKHDGYAPSIAAYILIFPAGLQDFGALSDGVFSARPGETVTMNWSYPDFGSPDLPAKQTVAVPFINGAPLDRRWYVSIASPPGDGTSLMSARKRFDVQLPTEPGKYRVMLGSWKDAFLLPVELDGDRHQNVSATWPAIGSNIVTFEVSE